MDNTKDALSEFNDNHYVDDRRSTACYAQEITELKQQLDELRKACEYALKIIEENENWWIDCPDKGGFDTDILKAAIAKVS